MATDLPTALAAELMDLLDHASNAFGPLSPEQRARVAAAVLDPTQATWHSAHTLIVSGAGWVTLWQAVTEHTEYDVTSRDMQAPWPSIPTPEQIITALRATLTPAPAPAQED